jgi:hypothetical protein
MGSSDGPFNEPGTEFSPIYAADTDAGDQRESPASDAFSGSTDVAGSEDQSSMQPLDLSKVRDHGVWTRCFRLSRTF